MYGTKFVLKKLKVSAKIRYRDNRDATFPFANCQNFVHINLPAWILPPHVGRGSCFDMNAKESERQEKQVAGNSIGCLDSVPRLEHLR